MAEILITTDLSDTALNAAEYGVRLFGADGDRFTLLHTYMEPLPADPIMVTASPTLALAANESMNAWEKRFAPALKGNMDRVRSFVDFGSMASRVEELTRDNAYAAVVIGVPSDEGSWWFGGGAGEVIKVSHAPVLAVPPMVRFNGMKRMVLASDGGDVHPAALALVRELAGSFNAEVLVLRVLPENKPDVDADGDPVYNALLSGMAHSFISVRSNDVVSAIDAEAIRHHADIVVLLHRHLGALEELFHVSTAKKLALHTHLPLLVLQQG